MVGHEGAEVEDDRPIERQPPCSLCLSRFLHLRKPPKIHSIPLDDHTVRSNSSRDECPSHGRGKRDNTLALLAVRDEATAPPAGEGMEFHDDRSTSAKEHREERWGTGVEEIGRMIREEAPQHLAIGDHRENKGECLGDEGRANGIERWETLDIEVLLKSVVRWRSLRNEGENGGENEGHLMPKPHHGRTDLCDLMPMGALRGEARVGNVGNPHGVIAYLLMATSPQRTILAFGYHDLQGTRHWVIRRGLEEGGFRILECRTEHRGFLPKCLELVRKYRSMQKEADYVLLPFLGHYLVPLAWLLSRRPRKPLIFDAFLSLYDTSVDDRALVPRWHPRAWFLFLIDWLSCHLPDVILLDTEEHRQYFTERYGIPAEKILILPIGARTDIFRPQGEGEARSEPELRERFRVEFHGTYIPLQGIETILHAAALLQEQQEDVQFVLIGRGQTFSAMQALTGELRLRNVHFEGQKSLGEVAQAIHDAHLCLGIFGITAKADRVIPHKAYEVLACRKPLITGRTHAALRLFQEGKNALLVPPGDAPALAGAILQLKEDPELRLSLAEGGYRLSLEHFQPKVIVAPLVRTLERWLAGSSSPGSPASLAATSHGAASRSDMR
jgi:glycosyltransferase involved in cell wall biosynthesis